MTDLNFVDEILDFAIGEEQGAHDFYLEDLLHGGRVHLAGQLEVEVVVGFEEGEGGLGCTGRSTSVDQTYAYRLSACGELLSCNLTLATILKEQTVAFAY